MTLNSSFVIRHSSFRAAAVIALSLVISHWSFAQPRNPRPRADATASFTISNASPGEIINVVTTVEMAGSTNSFTNQIKLPLTLPAPPSNSVVILQTYYGAPKNNFIVEFTAPPWPLYNYTNCALFAASSISGPWTWLGSFPNHGQLVAMIVTNNGSSGFFRAANVFTP